MVTQRTSYDPDEQVIMACFPLIDTVRRDVSIPPSQVNKAQKRLTMMIRTRAEQMNQCLFEFWLRKHV